ncbi:unnamed protein product [Toxocara canis]|uniref:Transposase n=1 Tax=Toxocara canis TaxID=6265 RepID=A0A183UDI8_TOXCA|nr:unnamed protein product [Toxocara canis]
MRDALEAVKAFTRMTIWRIGNLKQAPAYLSDLKGLYLMRGYANVTSCFAFCAGQASEVITGLSLLRFSRNKRGNPPNGY